MSDDARRRAAELMREALSLLDAAGEPRATPHLQLALDLLDEDGLRFFMPESSTCH